jgi:hypothetical protein
MKLVISFLQFFWVPVQLHCSFFGDNYSLVMICKEVHFNKNNIKFIASWSTKLCNIQKKIHGTKTFKFDAHIFHGFISEYFCNPRCILPHATPQSMLTISSLSYQSKMNYNQVWVAYSTLHSSLGVCLWVTTFLTWDWSTRIIFRTWL